MGKIGITNWVFLGLFGYCLSETAWDSKSASQPAFFYQIKPSRTVFGDHTLKVKKNLYGH